MSTTNGFNGAVEPPSEVRRRAHVQSRDDYERLHRQSVDTPEAFWTPIAEQFHWHAKWTKFLEYNFNVNSGPISIKCMLGAKTNLSYNCLDRHLDLGNGDKIAYHWIGNDPTDEGRITYRELLRQTCRFANVLKSKGLRRGDRVAVYMPMIVELPIALLACARLGLVHSVVFAGFSADSLAERILDSKCSAVITADGFWRGTKLVELKKITDDALQKCVNRGHQVTTCVCVRHLGPYRHHELLAAGDSVASTGKRPYGVRTPWSPEVDCWWHEEVERASDSCDCEWMDAEDPSFILYTSGSTGKPKGVLHTVAGYMLYTATTFKYSFDYHDDDVYWCTADVGWITGHSYIVYGPLLNGATGVIFEGTPFYPDAGRFWEVCAQLRVTIFYTAPTAIRSLMGFGNEFVKRHSRSSLRILGTVGEPINPEAWLWYYNVVGERRCAVVDTYWQTETGGHVITPLPGAVAAKPGSACFPFFGVVAKILDEETGAEIVEPNREGYLVFAQPWPSTMRTVYGDHKRFEETYFRKFPGFYTTGDGAKRDADGYLWVTGRIDDMLNVSGHLLSTAEIESALVEHELVAEAAVVSHPHAIKGECTYAFVTLNSGVEYNAAIVKQLKLKVRGKIGAFAAPEYVQNAPGLPKTRSGKIMRRVLRKIARGETDFGDTSTLADASVLETLFKYRDTAAEAMVTGHA